MNEEARLPNEVQPSLRRSFSWTLAGNVIYAACQWGVLIVLAKVVGTEQVGQFSLGLAIGAPIMLFANLQLRNIQATDSRGEYRFGYYLVVRLGTTLMALLTIVGIALLGSYSSRTAGVIVAVGAAKAVEAISDVYYGLFQQHQMMDLQAKSMILKGFLSVSSLALCVVLSKSVVWGSVSMALAWTLTTVLYDIPNGNRVQRRLRDSDAVSRNADWQWSVVRKLVWTALPMGFVAMLLSLNANIPRYFLEGRLGEHGLGIFSGLAYLMVAGNTVVSALAQAATPKLAFYVAQRQRRSFLTLLLKLFGLGTFLGVAGVLASLFIGRWLLGVLYTPEFGENVTAFIWLMVAAGIGYLAAFLVYALNATRAFHVQLPVFIGVAGATALASHILIPLAGVVGAAYAMVIQMTVQCLLCAAVLWWIVRTKFQLIVSKQGGDVVGAVESN